MLRSALTRAKRGNCLRLQCMPFVNSHKYDTADVFMEAHPSCEGDRNRGDEQDRFLARKGPVLCTHERYHHGLKNSLI
ncbi:unnamed protein product [Ectocarpus sp. 4 AP-2014]